MFSVIQLSQIEIPVNSKSNTGLTTQLLVTLQPNCWVFIRLHRGLWIGLVMTCDEEVGSISSPRHMRAGNGGFLSC